MTDSPILSPGQRFLVMGKTRLARMIHKNMVKYAGQMGYDPRNAYTHAGVIISYNQNMRIVEAVANGVVPNRFSKHYDIFRDDVLIVEPAIPYTEDELYRIQEYAMDLVAINNFYQYWSLVSWWCYVNIAFKYKGKWHRLNLFGKGNKFNNVCYEAAYRIVQYGQPDEFPGNPELKTCFDLIRPVKDRIVWRNP